MVGAVLAVTSLLVSGASLVLPWIQGKSLTLNPLHTIHQCLVILIPVLLVLYSSIVKSCSRWQSFTRGLVSIPIGALVVAFFGVLLGAPVGKQYAWQTLYWSLLMSTLAIAPAATVLGASWGDWQRLFAFTKPVDAVELSISIPAHAVVVGAWVGAWPIPLDWDRKWQEWPISCTYGAIAGYLVGNLVTAVLLYVKPPMRIKSV